MNSTLSVGFEKHDFSGQALELAKRLGLKVNNTNLPRLHVTSERIELLMPEFSPLAVDFSQGTWKRRHDAGKKQGLVRACKPSSGMQIIDATAGWGRDAALLASFGAKVLMLERSPIMAALLEDGLKRMESDSSLVKRLSLKQTDATTFLYDLPEEDYPDVIYLDPMHPVRQKSALVKKEMQALQQILGPDEDAQTLIQIAQKRALHRVVVKWPQHEKPLTPPSMSLEGKTVRFDVYIIHR